MAIITDEMRDAIARCKLCFAATVNEDGTPNLSPKASLSVIEGDRLGFCNLASPQTVANIRRNPAVEVNIVDIFIRKGFRFSGSATVLGSGPVFEQVERQFIERAGPDYTVIDVVDIAVEHATPLISPLYMVRPDADEAEVRKHYMAIYCKD